MATRWKKYRDFTGDTLKLEEKLKEHYLNYREFARKGALRIKKTKPGQLLGQQQLTASQQQQQKEIEQEQQRKSGKIQVQMEMSENQYYYNMNESIYLESPEIQLDFQQQLLQSLKNKIKPIQSSLICHQITKQIQNIMIPSNDPTSTQRKLLQFYKRRVAYLDSKKKKTVSRYSHFIKSSQTASNAIKWEQFLLSRINLIDLELSSILERIERLKSKDEFGKSITGQCEKPIVVNEFGNKIYRVSDDGEMCFSNISREDVEVYLRSKLFENKSKRQLSKLLYSVKWIHYQKRVQFIEHVNNELNKNRMKWNNDWSVSYKKLREHFITRVAQKFVNNSNEMKSVVAKFFDQMKPINADEKEYANLSVRNDFLPLWPSTLIEQETLLKKAYNLFFFTPDDRQLDIHHMTFQMNVATSILFENQIDVSTVTSKEETLLITEDDSSKKQNKAVNKDKISSLDEGPLKTLISALLVPKKVIIIAESEWIKLLDFQYEPDQYQLCVINQLIASDIPEDSASRLIIKFLANRDFEILRQFLSEQTKNIIMAAPDKFFLYIENLKYTEKTHNSISLELLVDAYNEGLQDKNNPFDTMNSRKLESKTSLKSEYLDPLMELITEQLPQEIPTQTAYGFFFLKCLESRRKLVQILNALRSIERRITYELIKILECQYPREVDDEFLVKVSEDKGQDKVGKESVFLNPNKKQEQVKRRNRITSFSSTKNLYDETFRNSLASSQALGRFDEIIYEIKDQDHKREGEIPEIYLKGDEKDGVAGYGQYIIYDIVMQDISDLETRLVKISSIFLNRMEKISRIKDLNTLGDRFQIMQKLYQQELTYQFAKLQLVEQYMQLLENISDNACCYSIAESIMNILKEIPYIDFKGHSFENSYQYSIQRFNNKAKLIKQLFSFQKHQETYETEKFHLKFQKLLQNVPYSNFQQYKQQSQGGHSLSKEANSEQNMQFLEQRVSKFEKKKEESLIGVNLNDKNIKSVNYTYDQFCLERDMEEVFKNIITKKASSNNPSNSNSIYINNNSKLSRQSSSAQPQLKQEEQSINTDELIHQKFEGGPHFLYVSSHLPKRRFSPSAEEDNFLNFYESAIMVYKIIQLIDQISVDLQQQIPMKSLISYVILQDKLIQSISQQFEEFTFKSGGDIEESVVCDDENSLSIAVQKLVRKSLDTIEQNNEEFEQQSQISVLKNEQEIIDNHDYLMSLDIDTLQSVLNHTTALKSKNYRELFFSCNLVQFAEYREQMLHSIWEEQILNTIYKQQHQYYNIVPKKKGDIWFSQPLQQHYYLCFAKIQKYNLVRQEQSNSKIKSKQTKQQKLKLSYLADIDSSSKKRYSFDTVESIQLALSPDNIDELNNVLVYEKLQLKALGLCVRLNQYRIDKFDSSEMDIQFLLNKKVIVESPSIDISRLYLTHTNLTSLLQTFKEAKREAIVKLRELHLRSIIQIKSKFRLLMSSQYYEYQQQLTKQGQTKNSGTSSISQAPSLSSSIILEKKLMNLRGVLAKQMILDILNEINKEYCRLECIHLTKHLSKIAHSIQGLDKEIEDLPYADKLFEEIIFAGQKKISKLPQQDEKDNDGKQQNQSKQMGILFKGNNWKFIDNITLMNTEWFLTQEFNDNSNNSNQKNEKKLFEEGITSDLLKQKCALLPIESLNLKEQLRSDAAAPNRKISNYFSKNIASSTRQNMFEDSWNAYSSGQLQQLALFYKQLLSFCQTHIISASLGLGIQEASLFHEMITFSLDYTALDVEKEVSRTLSTGRDVNKALMAYDYQVSHHVDSKTNKDDKNKGKQEMETFESILSNKSNNISKLQQSNQVTPAGKKSIVSVIIDNLVRKLESHSNLAESFKNLEKDIQGIKVKWVTNNNSNSNNNNTTSQEDNNNNNNNSTFNRSELNRTLKIIMKDIKKKGQLIYTKLYITLLDYFINTCKEDPQSEMPTNFFNFHLAVFASHKPNKLNLNHFNTQFYLPNQSNLMQNLDDYKLFKIINRRPFKDTNNDYKQLMKLKLLFLNLPIQLDRTSYKLHVKSLFIQKSTIQSLYSPYKQYSSSLNMSEYVHLEDLPIVGLQNYSSFATHALTAISRISEAERYRISGQLRNLEREIKPIKAYKNEPDDKIEEETKYIQKIAENKIMTQVLSIYNHSVSYPLSSIQFYRYLQEQKNLIQEKVVEVKNSFDEYMRRGFPLKDIDFYQPYNLKILDENVDNERIKSNMISICVENTFLFQQFNKCLMQDSIDIYQREYSVSIVQSNISSTIAQKNNSSGSNKIKILANPYLSSPLFIDTSSLTLPIPPKVAFVQAFINRFRNKVSRVDLLSSGFGFVISVNDLEDCVQFLSKSVMTFGEKEIKKRMDSAQYLFDLQNSKIKAQSKTIEILRQRIKAVEIFQKANIDALVHEKGNNLIYEMEKMKRNQTDFTRYLNHFENDVALEVKKEINDDLLKLQRDKELLRNQFQEFKRVLTVSLTNDIRTVGKDVEVQIQKKTGDATNFSRFPASNSEGEDKNLSNSIQFKRNQQSEDLLENEGQGLASRCSVQLDQTIFQDQQSSNVDLLDPVIIMKLINKLRYFYLLKIGTIKSKYETEINTQSIEINKLSDLQQQLNHLKKEENILKKEIVHLHNALKEQEKINQDVSAELQILTFEKLKLEKQRDDLLALNRQADKDYMNKINTGSLDNGSMKSNRQSTLAIKEKEIEKLMEKDYQNQQALNILQYHNKRQLKQVQQQLKCETSLKNSLLLRIDPSQLLNKLPSTQNETEWQQQCQQLYIKCEQLTNQIYALEEITSGFANNIRNNVNNPQYSQVQNELVQLCAKVDQYKQQQQIAQHQQLQNIMKDGQQQQQGIFSGLPKLDYDTIKLTPFKKNSALQSPNTKQFTTSARKNSLTSQNDVSFLFQMKQAFDQSPNQTSNSSGRQSRSVTQKTIHQASFSLNKKREKFQVNQDKCDPFNKTMY